MIRTAGIVVALALLAAACGNKTEHGDPGPSADAAYIDRDLGPLLAQVEAATGPLRSLAPNAGRSAAATLMTARSYLAGVLVGASKLTPPAAWRGSLDALVAIVTDMAAAVDELQMAVDAPPDTQGPATDAASQAQQKLAATLARHAEWKTAFAQSLAAAHITPAPLPAPPPPTTKPPVDPTPYPCAGPCPCTDSSIEKTGDVITKCLLSRDYGVSGVHCGAGPVLFDATSGELAECTSAAMFTPYPPEAAGTPAERVVTCGLGPVTRAAYGVSSCILSSDLVVGAAPKTTTIARTARVFFAAPNKLVRAVMPDGAQTCFDDAGATAACPR